ncbi:hypothetical protein KFU94_38865 [Chloroflexi bacterium TSY]|nr:hypothetical protein [Chloroflexi bacterium TSY]
MSKNNPSTPDADTRQQRLADLSARSLAAAQAQFDPVRHLVAQSAADRPQVRTYRQATSLPLAHLLLVQGDSEAVYEAAAIVAAVLESQEIRERHPHRGNWRWLADDPEVGDLNAVQFVLRGLLPLLVDHGDYLPIDLQERCRESVRLALEEEERLDVAPTYTNIHIQSLFGLLVGAEWLADEHFLSLGKTRWARWVRFTVENGAPHEYNSPGYGGVDLSALAVLHQYVKDPLIRLQAKLLYERFWLHLALHLHRPTSQLAGPHCRSYWWQMVTGRGPLKDTLWLETGWPWSLEPGPYGGDDEPPTDLELALAQHHLPEYLIPWFERQEQVLPYEVSETANREEGFDLTTYHTASYALGTASKTYAIGTDCYYIEHHANYLILHYTRPPESGGWGMMYSRYVVNDRHWGTMGAAPDRSKESNFYDHGHFAGIQQRNKAIGLYALQPQHVEVFSLKTVVAFQSGAELEGVWINETPVDLAAVGQTLQIQDWLIVEDGGVYIGVRPLEPSVLSHRTPIKLERGPLGELWLAIYNYQGAAIRFWEYASLKGAFWRGNLRAGFVVEVAERHEYASAAEFLVHLRQAHIVDGLDEDRIRTVTYKSGGEALTLRYDLWNSCPVERQLNGQSYQSPNLTSPLAVQGDTGYLQVGQARLYTQPQQMWLVAQELDPMLQTYVAVNPSDQPTSLRLETPAGTVSASAWGLGRLTWHVPKTGEQVVIVESLQPPIDLTVPDGVRIQKITAESIKHDRPIDEGAP